MMVLPQMMHTKEGVRVASKGRSLETIVLPLELFSWLDACYGWLRHLFNLQTTHTYLIIWVPSMVGRSL